MFNEEGLQLVNQVIVSLPGIHGVILGFVLGRLKRLVFMGTSSNDTSVGSTEIFGKSSARSARSSVPEEIKSLPRRWIDFWNDDTPSAVKSIVQI